MNRMPVDIFHLVRAKIALRKAFAFCGLVAILLTASCGPSSSGSNEISLPKFDESTGTDTRDGIQIKPDALPETKLAKPNQKNDPIPESIPQPIPVSKVKASIQPSSATQSGGTVGDPSNGSNGDGNTSGDSKSRPVKDDIHSIVERLNSNYLWATMPTFVDIYKDPSGQIHEHFQVSPGDSPELQELLAKMRDDLVARDNTVGNLQVEIKEQGACDGETKEASTKSCDTKAPICLSLEYIGAKTLKANLEQALRPLIMREFARQHGADEAMAKQVQRYYELPAVQNFKSISRIASIFNRVRVSLLYLKSALTTGMTPNAGDYAQKIDSKEEICNMIAQGAAQALVLQDQVTAPQVALTESLKAMSRFCDGNSLDRQALLQPLDQAIKSYDQLAQEFSKNSGMIVVDFSKHLWAH